MTILSQISELLREASIDMDEPGTIIKIPLLVSGCVLCSTCCYAIISGCITIVRINKENNKAATVKKKNKRSKFSKQIFTRPS